MRWGVKGKVATGEPSSKVVLGTRTRYNRDQPRNAQERKGNSHQTLLSNHQMLPNTLALQPSHFPFTSTEYHILVI